MPLPFSIKIETENTDDLRPTGKDRQHVAKSELRERVTEQQRRNRSRKRYSRKATRKRQLVHPV